jgi:pimeloyl-ACP methyl ester carboxylesterase
MTDRYVETNGIRLHYLEYGSGDPTLILTHGLTANAHSFDGLIEAGLATAMRVLSVDLRGRGESDKPESGYTMMDHAVDLLGLLDALDLDSVTLGGHSFGGLLTYYLAANHPDRVNRCVVLDAPAEVHEGILDQIKPSLDRLEVVLPSWEHYLDLIKAMPYYDGWWDPTIEAFYRADVRDNADGTVQAKSDPGHIRQAVEGTLTVDWPQLVSTIDQPTLFLRATDPFGPPGAPPIVPEDQGRATIERIRNSRLESIPGNHITYLFGSSAPRLVAAIREFVEQA